MSERKRTAVIPASLETGPLGLLGRVGENLGGRPILRRIVENLIRCDPIDEVAIVALKHEQEALAGLLDGLHVSWHEPGPDLPYSSMWRRGRKWSLSAWRGGIGNASVFDEWGSPAELYRILCETESDLLIKPSVLNPFVDGRLIGELVDTMRERGDQGALMTAAPPGFNYELLRRPFLEETSQKGLSVREVIALFLDRTNKDPISTGIFHQIDERLLEGRWRVSADSRRSIELLTALDELLTPGPEGYDAIEIFDLLQARPDLWHGSLPREIELEITGRDQLADPQRPRPRGDCEDMSESLYRSLIEEMAQYDDAVLTLGGYGEPLLHPDLPRFLEIAREAGIWGIHIVTNGIALEGELARTILDAGVDVVTITVDAHRPETYRQINGTDAFETVLKSTEAFIRDSAALQENAVYVLPEMIKRNETLPEMEAFFDTWYRRTGWALIRTFPDMCGQIEDRSPLPLFLSQRNLCRKIQNAIYVHCDGNVPVCNQDYLGKWPAGRVPDRSIEEIWTGSRLADLRRGQQEGDYDGHPLCPKCRVWQSV